MLCMVARNFHKKIMLRPRLACWHWWLLARDWKETKPSPPSFGIAFEA
jgi:hypothetical protein